MVAFVIGRPISSDRPRITVDSGQRPGVHRFQLVVVDTAGNRSVADEVRVQVSSPTAPPTPPTPFTPGIPVVPITPITPVVPPPRPPRPRRKP